MFLPLSQLPKLSPNRQAFPLVEEFLAKTDVLRIEVHKQNEATVIDCGVHVPGGWEAGVLFASVCLGGLAQVKLLWLDFSGLRWPAVEVVTDHPLRACMASQYAGWPIQQGELFAMASGPGRALVHHGSLFKLLGYEDHCETAIICLESDVLPTDEVVQTIALECHCDPKNLYILVAPTASQVGTVQIAARAIEIGLSKLMELGYNLGKIDSGWGVCPVSPVASDHFSALGRTNDAILYGSTVLYNVRDEECLDSLVKQVPSCSSKEYGRPFIDVYKEYGNFYNIDRLLFSPAEVWLCNSINGRSFHAGSLRPDILRHSFGLEAQ
ncbi:MAG TPA: methenyltetrahydromethanopterin cyclohydrolase [Desulfosporosinus sp.]|nr:methenyltetrahydromethanopterin cyclohydrolase [Desulfosporosinus sp.]